MSITNDEICEILNKTADLLDIKGENPFRIRAYRNACRTIESLTHNISDMLKDGKDITELPGIGHDLSEKIHEIVTTGQLSLLNALQKELDIDVDNLMRIQSLGPHRIKTLYHELGIHSLKDLEEALKRNIIKNLPGFGEKTQQNILDGLIRLNENKGKLLLFHAEDEADALIKYLKKKKDLANITIAGSYRRKKQTIRDLDILVTSTAPSVVIDHFTKYNNIAKITAKGETKSTIILNSGLQVDLRVVPKDSYGSALHYFTGSKEHNISIRQLALQQGLKVSEYGVFKGAKKIAGKTENEIFKVFNLPYIEPELRENRGELEAAANNALPKLITLSDLRGDLHMHSGYTDGRNTIEEMAKSAKKLGYEYIAMTDHSKKVTVAHGMDEKTILKQLDEIDSINDKIKGITILKGIEVDILENGMLDISDDILKRLDLRICSIHYNFNLSEEKQTARIIKAMDNQYFNILGHPTGRLINERPPYNVNIEKIIQAAKERKCFIELNSHPQRLDLDDIHCKMAKEAGVKISINTDSHSIDGFELIKYGINQARRGWLEAKDVLNTGSLSELRKLIKRS
ncbi:MAG: DNA polymerase/3'-5' exonuclease PolX [Elusimicrobiota bacterium]